jgi:hypothetical protein
MFRAAIWLILTGISACRRALQQEAHVNAQALKDKRERKKKKCKRIEKRVFIVGYEAFV